MKSNGSQLIKRPGTLHLLIPTAPVPLGDTLFVRTAGYLAAFRETPAR